MGKFKNIHIFIKKNISNSNNKQNISETTKIFNTLIGVLTKCNSNLSFDISCKQLSSLTNKLTTKKYFKNNTIPKSCDLIIVIGGDGSILNCTRKTINCQIPILGVHHGRLGFLADLNINNIKPNLVNILSGGFIQENRSILCATIKKSLHKSTKSCYLAVNDIVLCNDKIPKLIEFQIFINNQFVLQQRADGLIVSTPTGSTAYSLSAGGPILYPTLNNFTLIPLYPHTLSSRPIVISDDSTIKLKILNQQINKNYNSNCSLSFDGQENITLEPGDQVIINKYPLEVKLIHPEGYNYFATLREKLGWNHNKNY